VAAAKARVASAEAQLHLAEAELAKTYLRAPTSGRVLQVYAEPGELASPNSPQPVLVLADVSRRRVRAFVEELDIARVKVGQPVWVTADSFPNREFVGKVALVVPRMGKRAVQSDAPGEYRDVYFREVLIDLQNADDVVVNLRVRTRIVTGKAEEVR
jgi:multidrug resistance efflux pump